MRVLTDILAFYKNSIRLCLLLQSICNEMSHKASAKLFTKFLIYVMGNLI